MIGHLTFLSRFIPRLAERIKPILKVMKNDAQRCWSDQCEKAFGEVKEILIEPPVMVRPESGYELHIFLATSDEAISATLVQETPKFKIIYFVSSSLKDAKI